MNRLIRATRREGLKPPPEDLTCTGARCHCIRPASCRDEESRSVWAAQHAGEAAEFRGDGLQHLAAFANPNAPAARHLGEPHCTLGINTDAVGSSTIKFGPDPTVGKIAIWCNVVRGQHPAVGLGHDQRRVVGHYCHAIRESEAFGKDCPVRPDECDEARCEFTVRKVEADVVHVVLPRPSDTMSFHGLVESAPSLAYVLSVPSGERTSRSSPATTSSRPSGSRSRQNGIASMRVITSCLPSRSKAMTSPAPQSEKTSRSHASAETRREPDREQT